MGKPMKIQDSPKKSSKRMIEIKVNEKVEQGIYLNHLAYRLADVINTYMVEAIVLFENHGCTLKHEEKRKFTKMMEAAKALKYATKDFTKAMYECNIADKCLDSSDFFADFIKLTWDRVGEDADRQRRVRNAVRRFDSQLEFYKDPFYIETRKKRTKSKKNKEKISTASNQYQ